MGTVQVRSKPIVPAQAALILAIAAAGTLLAAPTPVSAASAISQPRGPISWDSNSDDQLGIGAAFNQQDPRAIAPPCAIVPYPDLRPAGLRRPPETAPAVADLDLTAGLALLGCEPVRALVVEPPEDRAALGVTDKPAVARLRS